jgi:hypothetical protein
MILYHFTSLLHLPKIMQAGHLRTSETNLHPTIEHYGPDAVWFIDIPELGEHDHGLNASLPGEVRPDKTAVRFTVEVPDKRVVSWLPWAEAQGIDPQWLNVLTHEDGGREGASHWKVVFRSVPEDQWIAVETRQPDGTWKPVDESTMAEVEEAYRLMQSGHFYTHKSGASR